MRGVVGQLSWAPVSPSVCLCLPITFMLLTYSHPYFRLSNTLVPCCPSDWLRQDCCLLLSHHRVHAAEQLPACCTRLPQGHTLCAHSGAHPRADLPGENDSVGASVDCKGHHIVPRICKLWERGRGRCRPEAFCLDDVRA